ncbi:aspartic peptidase domain-containing protein [Halteromyces radiatus]|uniref:aspartic peptidase domain-containing protein n=1 Tax=Halteromyces radiatus TaxID=101107 RepID=UPI00221E4095|nr:aspartic peptidase domain-containing protein [Halteromyces radiatus]KAI8075981.1 aspartic peptidase domain-containing protein [Halteromyces radiatus]
MGLSDQLDGVQIPSLESQEFHFPSVTDPFKVPLHFMDGIPTVSFTIGSPPQSVVGVFDTATLISWVMSDKCNSTVCSTVENKFSREKSSTNTALDYTIGIKYVDGSFVRVRPELDTLTLLESSISYPEHLIGEAYEVYYPKGYPTAANGRLGVGDFGVFQKYLDDAQGLIQGVDKIVNGILMRAVGDDRTSSGYAASGSPDFKKRDGVHAPFYWTLGSDPSKYTGKLYDLPLASVSLNVLSPFWKLNMHGIKLIPYQQPQDDDNNQNDTENKKNMLPKQSSALLRLTLSDTSFGSIDSSTPYIHLPKHLSQALNQRLGAQYDNSLKLYTIPCERKKIEPLWLIFELDGVDALIPAHQYMIERHKKCHTAIVDSDDDDQVHLGGPFFRSFYLEYRLTAKEVGIAESTAKLGLLRPPSKTGSYDLLNVDLNEMEVPI